MNLQKIISLTQCFTKEKEKERKKKTDNYKKKLFCKSNGND